MLHSQNLTGQQVVDIFFEITGCWVTLPNNLAVGINKDTEGDTVYFKILICIVFAVVLPVLLNACPLFALHVLF